MSEIYADGLIVRISEMLVRRRSEHNDGEIGSLEELSLAQERLGKIEHLQNWCSGLRILLLQDNLIPAIVFRAAQKERATTRLQHVLNVCQSAQEEELKQLWSSASENCPEERVALAALSLRQAPSKAASAPPATTRRLWATDGRPLNVNQAKIPFTLTEDASGNSFVLDVSVYRHLDTALIDVDVQPTHVTLTIRGKVLQLVFPAEVHSDCATVRRSQITGHLQITAPKVGAVLGAQPLPRREPPQSCVEPPVDVDELEVPPLE